MLPEPEMTADVAAAADAGEKDREKIVRRRTWIVLRWEDSDRREERRRLKENEGFSERERKEEAKKEREQKTREGGNFMLG